MRELERLVAAAEAEEEARELPVVPPVAALELQGGPGMADRLVEGPPVLRQQGLSAEADLEQDPTRLVVVLRLSAVVGDAGLEHLERLRVAARARKGEAEVEDVAVALGPQLAERGEDDGRRLGLAQVQQRAAVPGEHAGGVPHLGSEVLRD